MAICREYFLPLSATRTIIANRNGNDKGYKPHQGGAGGKKADQQMAG